MAPALFGAAVTTAGGDWAAGACNGVCCIAALQWWRLEGGHGGQPLPGTPGRLAGRPCRRSLGDGDRSGGGGGGDGCTGGGLGEGLDVGDGLLLHGQRQSLRLVASRLPPAVRLVILERLVVELEVQLAGRTGVGSQGLGVLDGQPAVQGVVDGHLAQRQRHMPYQWPTCQMAVPNLDVQRLCLQILHQKGPLLVPHGVAVAAGVGGVVVAATVLGLAAQLQAAPGVAGPGETPHRQRPCLHQRHLQLPLEGVRQRDAAGWRLRAQRQRGNECVLQGVRLQHSRRNCPHHRVAAHGRLRN
mmetsp:Transcript_731/g.2185  ORF Transcript_731/g.2185 Transcript_731/m.2185 type:complete len:300 (-) Transcript_731:1092-1991(-)